MKQLQSGQGKDVPPTSRQVLIYFRQQNRSTSEAMAFFDYFHLAGWVGPRGAPVKSWKRLAWRWIWMKR